MLTVLCIDLFCFLNRILPVVEDPGRGELLSLSVAPCDTNPCKLPVFLVAPSISLLSTVDAVMFLSKKSDNLPKYLLLFTVFSEIYSAFIVCLHSAVFYFVIDKFMLIIADSLKRLLEDCQEGTSVTRKS